MRSVGLIGPDLGEGTLASLYYSNGPSPFFSQVRISASSSSFPVGSMVGSSEEPASSYRVERLRPGLSFQCGLTASGNRVPLWVIRVGSGLSAFGALRT